MSEKARKSKAPPFVMLRHEILDSSAWLRLSAHARCLLIELARQFRGCNNGDLCATFSVMHPRGIGSRGTLHSALRELLASGLIEQTRQGGKNRCSLYALTWEAIDDCRDGRGRPKLDVNPTRTPSNRWRGN